MGMLATPYSVQAAPQMAPVNNLVSPVWLVHFDLQLHAQTMMLSILRSVLQERF